MLLCSLASSRLSCFYYCLPSPTNWYCTDYVSLLESNVKILEEDCDVAQLFVDAATSRKDHLYLGLDISTQSTGYAVLKPSPATMSSPLLEPVDGDNASDPERVQVLLREVGEANLMEWGVISGNGSDGKKGDEVDVGVIVEDTLMRVAARCRRCVVEVDRTSSPSSSPTPSGAQEHEIDGNSGVMGLEVQGSAAAAGTTLRILAAGTHVTCGGVACPVRTPA